MDPRKEDAQQPDLLIGTRSWFKYHYTLPDEFDLKTAAVKVYGAIRLVLEVHRGRTSGKIKYREIKAIAEVSNEIIRKAMNQLAADGLIHIQRFDGNGEYWVSLTEVSDQPKLFAVERVRPSTSPQKVGAGPKKLGAEAPNNLGAPPKKLGLPPIRNAHAQRSEKESSDKTLRSEEEGADADQKDLFELASELFDRLEYRGNDAAAIWQVAVLVVHGEVPRAAAIDATNGVRACPPRYPIPYFINLIITRCPHVGMESKKDKLVLKPVELPAGWKTWPKSPPQKPETSQEVLDLVGTFKRSPTKTTITDEQKQEAIAALYLVDKADPAARDPPTKPK